MKMIGKGKKTVTLAYKEKLLAEIAHYEKRIEEALNKRKQNIFEDESCDEDSGNPYKLNIRQPSIKLKQLEASLSDRASMTLELAMLTVMQSEVNVMVTPPEVRRPVSEDGVWLEVAAECKIDLVSFTITFHAHKPHRRFAPVRYRNLVVTLVKPAQDRELAQSVLAKLNRPNLALQVLQSYATAFRSRRTTLLELAERYDDKLKMEAMPEGGYRVRFLNLLRVDWSLENMWSPIVPFCHRMKFEVEYMPKEYIHAIGKLYKQFKDPALETSERTLVLSKIFDTCLQAQGPARELQESFESDPDTAGRLHERRTTIDQEPDVPNVEQSPKKLKSKENKAQNRKTNMAPPKTIPKNVAKKRKGDKRYEDGNSKRSNVYEDADNQRDKRGLENSPANVDIENEKGVPKANEKGSTSTVKKTNAENVVENRKGDKRGIENDVPNKTKNHANENVENRKGVKRTMADDGSNGAKKSRTDESVSKNKPGLKGGTGVQNEDDAGDRGSKTTTQKKSNKVVNTDELVVAKNNDQKKNSGTVAKIAKAVDKSDTIKKGDNKGQSKSASDNSEGSGNVKKSNKKKDDIVADTAKDVIENSDRNHKTKKANTKTKEKNIDNSEDANTKNNVVSSKKDAEKNDGQKVPYSKKGDGNIVGSNYGPKTVDDGKLVTADNKTKSEVGISKNKPAKDGDGKNVLRSKDKGKGIDNNSISKKKVINKEAVNGQSSETSDKPKNIAKKASNDTNLENVGKASELSGKSKTVIAKKATPEDKNTDKIKLTSGNNVESEKKSDHKNMENDNEKLTQAKVTNKSAGKINTVKDKPTESNENNVKNDKNKEIANKNIVNSKTVEQKSNNNKKISSVAVDKTTKSKVANDAQKTNQNDKISTKSDTIQPSLRKTENKIVEKQSQKTNTEKIKNNNPTKSENVTRKILKETTNRDPIVKVVEKNKIQTGTTKNQKSNLLNVTITKTVPTTKIQVANQKIADKLKTKIPMMKNAKISLTDRVQVNNIGRISKGVEKTKIPMKSLPVFKKNVKNLPTRISPRKLPSTFMPSSRVFSIK